MRTAITEMFGIDIPILGFFFRTDHTRKLTLIGASGEAFDRTAEIYKLAGAVDKLTRPMPPRSRRSRSERSA